MMVLACSNECVSDLLSTVSQNVLNDPVIEGAAAGCINSPLHPPRPLSLPHQTGSPLPCYIIYAVIIYSTNDPVIEGAAAGTALPLSPPLCHVIYANPLPCHIMYANPLPPILYTLLPTRCSSDQLYHVIYANPPSSHIISANPPPCHIIYFCTTRCCSHQLYWWFDARWGWIRVIQWTQRKQRRAFIEFTTYGLEAKA